jgi:hypothetical protein
MLLNDFETYKMFVHVNGRFLGLTKAVDAFFENKGLIIEKLPMLHVSSFVIKK